MKPTHLLLFLLLAFSISCRNGNEKEVTPDPCLDPNLGVTSADFNVIEVPMEWSSRPFGKSFLPYHSDTVIHNYINFEPKDIEADSFKWTIGARHFLRKSLNEFNFTTRVQGDDVIPVTLEVWRRKENRKCPKDSGYAKFTRNVVFRVPLFDYQLGPEDCLYSIMPYSFGIYEGFINNDPNQFRRVQISACSGAIHPDGGRNVLFRCEGLIPNLTRHLVDGDQAITGYRQFAFEEAHIERGKILFEIQGSAIVNERRDSLTIRFDTINGSKRFDEWFNFRMSENVLFTFRGKRVL